MLNTKKNMVIIRDRIVTSGISEIKDEPQTHTYKVTYKNGKKVYSYNYNSIVWLKDPEVLDPSIYDIECQGQSLYDIESIYVFSDGNKRYWHICFKRGYERDYTEDELVITVSCLQDAIAKDVLFYLSDVAELNELKTDDGKKILSLQYDKIDFVPSDSALAVYLNPEKYSPQVIDDSVPIFPFGCNASQFKAVKAALDNQISVIQGPPGTGKTQTILNIIANLLLQGKTVQVVSSNNSAIDNVLEKLSSSEYEMGFIAALLGNTENKKDFIKKQDGKYPDLASWEDGSIDEDIFFADLRRRSKELSNIFSNKERLAIAKQELQDLKTEYKYFERLIAESDYDISATMRETLSVTLLMQLLQEFQNISEHIAAAGKISALRYKLRLSWLKLKMWFSYGIEGRSLYCAETSKIILFLQKEFYRAKSEELHAEVHKLEKALEDSNAKTLADEFSKQSMKYLKHKLFQRYGKNPKRRKFKENVFGWRLPLEEGNSEEQDNPGEHVNDGEHLDYRDFQTEYPVILSTTFASRSSLCKDAQYDYLIIDEASQVDVATGALALSCAKNAVIVGDAKQLPNVVPEDIQKRADAIFNSYRISKCYSFAHKSFLQSICELFPDIPQTLLREHYRCHPKIINFCNQKFYGGELIIMTEDDGKSNALSIKRTRPGNHARGHLNQRQIDVVTDEILPLLNCSPSEIGIIAPYKDQVKAMKEAVSNENILIATAHKFQGREKDTIIFSTVDNIVTNFPDQPDLLNVVISRAKKELYIVVSGNEQPQGSNISDLISYVEYNNFSVTESKVYSIFDHLYSQYTQSRIEYLKKHKRVSAFDSENLMYGLITDTLKEMDLLFLGIAVHLPLKMLLHDSSLMNDDERRFVINGAHIDFLIYNHLSKKPVLAIEVDGYYNHKENAQQAVRDKMKNHILELYEIPLIRFATNGSGEKEKLRGRLELLYADS